MKEEIRLFSDMTIKVSRKDGRGGTRSKKNRIEEDLKGTLDRSLLKFVASFNTMSNEKMKDATPMMRFLYDEIEFTRDLLNRVKLDLDSIVIDNAKVSLRSR